MRHVNTNHSTMRGKPWFKRLYIFGAGGHGRELAWLAQQIWGSSVELAFVVDKPEYLSAPVNKIPVRLISELENTSESSFIAATGDITTRRKAALLFENMGLKAAVLIHPNVSISETVEINPGVVICGGVTITTNIVISHHAHINIGCTISHDVAIGEFTTLSPGAHISGHVQVGRDVFIGTGASIINGQKDAPLTIGDGAVIAAGACLTRSANPGVLMVGVPAALKGPASSVLKSN